VSWGLERTNRDVLLKSLERRVAHGRVNGRDVFERRQMRVGAMINDALSTLRQKLKATKNVLAVENG
jgi:hypothetical protein